MIRSELVALRTTPTAMRFLAAALATSLFLAVSYLGVRQLASTTPEDAERAIQTATVAGVVALLFGAVHSTAAHRHGTFAAQRIAFPGHLAVARAVVLALAGAALGLLSAIAVVAVVGLLEATQGGPVPGASATAQTLAGTAAYSAASAVLGAGVGAVARSQPAAIAVALLVFVLGEPILANLSPEIATYGPAGLGASLAGADDPDTAPAALAGALLVAYGALATAAATAADRRDV